MSGVCPLTPARNRNTYDDTPPAKDSLSVNKPDAKFNTCGVSDNTDTVVAPRPDGETITTTQCCPTPGPPGPVGDTSCSHGFLYREEWADGNDYAIYDPSFDVCTDDIVLASDGNLYIAILDHIASATDEPAVGAQWETYWSLYLVGGKNEAIQDIVDGQCYKEGDIGTFDGCTYSADLDVCVDETDIDTVPDFYLDGGFSWTLISCPDEASWFEQILDGPFDWIKDIGQWGLEKLLGTFIADVMNGQDGKDGLDAAMITYPTVNIDTNYTGTETVALATSPTLQDVVSRICDLRGVTNYDVTNLQAVNVDMTVGSSTTGRALLDLLSLTYQFGMVDTGILKFIPHAPASSVKSLTLFDDLGYSSGASVPAAPISIKRLQAFDLPKVVNLTYQSTANAHEKFVQTATLETLQYGNEVNLEVPMSLTEQEAYDIAERILTEAHIGRTTYSFTTSYQNIELEPEDIINVETVGDLRILRVEESTEGGLLNIVAVNAANNDYIGTASGISPASPPPYIEAPKIISKSGGLLVEMPPLFPMDDNKLRLRVIPHGYGADNWIGCDIYYSTDGTSYNEWQQATKSGTWGRVATAIGGVSSHYVWDETNTVTVELKTGTLSSATELEVLNGANQALIGEEIIGFKNVSLISGTTYELTGLLRGRFGTENHISSHTNIEAFVFLDETIINLDVDANELGKDYTFKFVTKGSNLSDADPFVYTLNGKSRRPWPVANLNAVRACCNVENWTISWKGRNQFTPQLEDSATIDNPNMFGGYVMNILNPSTNAIVRTVTQQTSSYVYTRAQQITDFGTAQASIKIDIAQIDRIVGTGYNTITTFTE